MSGHRQRQRPLIGLSGRRRSGADIAGFPGSLGHLPIDLYLADYATGILAAGGLPVHLPMDADPADYADRLDGVLLSGGADLEPGLYGADPDGNGDYEPERDRLELDLLASAEDRSLPVLGICRGLQVINVAAGGTLNQHVPEHARYDVHPAGHVHDVSFDPGSLLAAIHGGEATRPGAPVRRGVNSLHHQTVDRIGDGLIVTAMADDGTVEGLESPAGDLVAVQWHPEMLDGTEPVFDWLVARAGERANHG
ncbi:MAG: gamma-glutamyl-gamma-aminobutyrate hydrolase family protein [Actinomycetota bacterium]